MSVTHPTSATRPMDPWTTLSLKLDFSRYVPRPVEPAGAHHVDSERWGRQLVLKSDTGKYLLLSERDEFIYESMDGTRSVQDLVHARGPKYLHFVFDFLGYVDEVLHVALRNNDALDASTVRGKELLLDPAHGHHVSSE